MKPLISTIVAIIAPNRQAHAVFPNFDESTLLAEDPSTCKPDATDLDGNHVDQRASLHWALVDANTIAHAGIVAAAHPNDPSFNYSFNPTDNVTVAQNLQTVIDMTEDPGSFRPGTHISMSCNDPDQCRLQNPWGYTAQWFASQKSLGYVYLQLMSPLFILGARTMRAVSSVHARHISIKNTRLSLYICKRGC
jgi:hypothetical protein